MKLKIKFKYVNNIGFFIFFICTFLLFIMSWIVQIWYNSFKKKLFSNYTKDTYFT